ncbi:MAG: hypothetical protein AAF597_11530 [Bacteroidota bacterium]
MTKKRMLPFAAVTMFFLAWAVGVYGSQWGLTTANEETTKGLLTGIGLGLLVWFGFALWKEE